MHLCFDFWFLSLSGFVINDVASANLYYCYQS